MGNYSEHIIPHNHYVKREDREKRRAHKSKVLWFTGLSGSGKSTLANGLEAYLHHHGLSTYILDGDNIRTGLNKDLDFSDNSRKENIRRIAEVARLFLDAGTIVLTAFISPFKEDRANAKAVIGANDFIEIHVDCPLEVCEARDVKGLYKKARVGEIKHFTGIDSPFEEPEEPEIRVNTAANSLEKCLEELRNKIELKIRL
ncbi:MAG: adenylyl-sulfate kinase [Ekhidna sp.]|nr:adenylyl-sulfate kinase [Ekhidna sp.]MBC6409690.1 adenylyl-sulfate kinase [Ekhidna sp.]